jgi:hypothetical protein
MRRNENTGRIMEISGGNDRVGDATGLLASVVNVAAVEGG